MGNSIAAGSMVPPPPSGDGNLLSGGGEMDRESDGSLSGAENLQRDEIPSFFCRLNSISEN